MKKIDIVLIVLLLAFTHMFFGVFFFKQGLRKGQEDTCGQLVAKLEKEIDAQKERAFQGDIENFEQSGCHNVIIRAINSNNEVKVAQFIQTDMMGVTKVVRVKIDGLEKNFEYHNFMQKIIKVECGDFYKW